MKPNGSSRGTTCSGCGTTLKPVGRIPMSPDNLVVVGKGQHVVPATGHMGKVCGVYFHVEQACFQNTKVPTPYFAKEQVSIPLSIAPYLDAKHHDKIRKFRN